MFLDTSFLIEMRKGNKKALKIFREMLEETSDVVISTINLYELYKGGFEVLRLIGSEKEIIWIEKLMMWVTLIPIDKNVARRGGQIYSTLKGKGIEIDDGDTLLLACMKEDDILLTCDKKLKKACEELGIKCIYVTRM